MAPNLKHARRRDAEEDPEQPCDTAPRDTKRSAPSRPALKSLQSYIPAYLRPYVFPYHGDFCYTPHFHVSIVAQLMMEGFLPISTPEVVLPKLHNQRCVITQRPHVPKQVRKKSKRFTMTINQNFDAVVDACRHQHGDHCWLYPALVKAFRTIHGTDAAGYPTVTAEKQRVKVRLYSIEVWNEESGALAAGELGYTVGSIFTSLTGFSCENSAGSVQLCALGCLLAECGFTVWDLGMEMEYKRALGSTLMPREEFVQAVRRVRTMDHLQLPTGSGTRRNCRAILDGTETFVEPAASKKNKTTKTKAPTKG